MSKIRKKLARPRRLPVWTPTASLTVSNADDLTSDERKQVAGWLRKTAAFLTSREVAHDGLSKRFRARLHLVEGIKPTLQRS